MAGKANVTPRSCVTEDFIAPCRVAKIECFSRSVRFVVLLDLTNTANAAGITLIAAMVRAAQFCDNDQKA